MKPAASSTSLAELAMPYLRELEPDRLRAVKMALDQLSILQREQISLTMPVIHVRER